MEPFLTNVAKHKEALDALYTSVSTFQWAVYTSASRLARTISSRMLKKVCQRRSRIIQTLNVG